MSKHVLFGSLDTLALLKFLSPDKFITSSLIRKQFHEIRPGTVYQKLKKLHSQGFVEVKSKKGDRAGDDRNEYKLTSEGVIMRKELVTHGLNILKEEIVALINKEKKDIETPSQESKDVNIKNIVMEFFGETEGLIDHETLEELQKILTKILEGYL